MLFSGNLFADIWLGVELFLVAMMLVMLMLTPFMD